MRTRLVRRLEHALFPRLRLGTEEFQPVEEAPGALEPGRADIVIAYKGELSRTEVEGASCQKEGGDWYVYSHFEPLAASFKRIQNILRQAAFEGAGSIAAPLLEAGPEQTLYNEFRRVSDTARQSEYLPALEAIASLRPAVDLFFDKVLVNAPDADVRRNRLTLLSSILTEFSTIADFSEIVTQ